MEEGGASIGLEVSKKRNTKYSQQAINLRLRLAEELIRNSLRALLLMKMNDGIICL
jgi:hypothetical protein